MFNISAYLNRIKYKKNIDTVSLETLKSLTESHVFNVPFENLDIYYKKKVSLNEFSLFEKIIINRRGGYCYELSILFNRLLLKLGFNSCLAVARLINSSGILNETSVHLVVVVKLQGLWLIDVSWAKGLIYPILIDSDEVQKQNFSSYKCIKTDEGIEIWEHLVKDEWKRIYILCMESPAALEMAYDRNDYHCKNPNSSFQKKIIIVKGMTNGFNMLTDEKFTNFMDGTKKDYYFSHEMPFYKFFPNVGLDETLKKKFLDSSLNKKKDLP